MKGDEFVIVRQATCDHALHRSYAQRRFDILNGFELNLTRCINCHKTLELDVKKFG
jgi:recombinational DNA repair protein (RecF pathway)